MSESLPILIIITSKNCDACKNLHRTGNFNRDETSGGPTILTFFGSKWDEVLFLSLITGKVNPVPGDRPAFRVYELELRSMNRDTIDFTDINPDKDPSRVVAFTEFMLDNSQRNKLSVVRHTYYNFTEDNLDGTIYLKDNTKYIDGERINKSFYGMITKIFPRGLCSLFYQYPSFMWFSRNEWNKALLNKNYVPYGDIFGLVMGERQVEGKKIWAVTAKDADLGERKTPILMGAYITAHPERLIGKFSVDAPKSKETPAPAKATEKTTDSTSVCKGIKIKIAPLVNTPGYYAGIH